jgi:hypothetical protein
VPSDVFPSKRKRRKAQAGARDTPSPPPPPPGFVHHAHRSAFQAATAVLEPGSRQAAVPEEQAEDEWQQELVQGMPADVAWVFAAAAGTGVRREVVDAAAARFRRAAAAGDAALAARRAG